eukprot:Pgem_evm1s19590
MARQYTKQEMKFIEECKTVKEIIDQNDVASFSNFVKNQPHTAHQQGIMIPTSDAEILMETLKLKEQLIANNNSCMPDVMQKIILTRFQFRKGLTPLMYAAACGAEEIVQYLVTTIGVHVGVINSGMTALDYSIKLCLDESKRNGIVQCLLNHGGAQYLEKETPSLCFACTVDTPNIHVIVELLLKHGANPNSRSIDYADFTPLMLSIKYEISSFAIKCLVNSGADVNLGTSDGMTPLAVAAKHIHISTVSYLLMYGASYTSGEDPLAFIHPAGRCHPLVESVVKKVINDHIIIATHRIPEMDTLSAIKFVYYILLSAIQTRNGEAVTHCLNILRSTAVFRGLELKEVFNIPSPTPHRLPYTPVQVACLHGYDDMLELLLSSVPVDINYKNEENETALDMAMKYQHSKCVELLKQHQHNELPPYTSSDSISAQHQLEQPQYSNSQVPLLQQPTKKAQQQPQQSQQPQRTPQPPPQHVQLQHIQPQHIQPQHIQPQHIQPQHIQPQLLQHHTSQPQLMQPQRLQHHTSQPQSRQPTKLGKKSVVASCSHCGSHEMTKVKSRTGWGTITMCFLTSFCFLCCVPFCGGCCKDKVHTCRNCRREIGRNSFF